MERFTKDIYICLCVLSWKTQSYQWDEIVKTLLGSYEEEYLCKSQPTDVSNNVTFFISNSSFKNDMRAWKHNGWISPPEIMI